MLSRLFKKKHLLIKRKIIQMVQDMKVFLLMGYEMVKENFTIPVVDVMMVIGGTEKCRVMVGYTMQIMLLLMRGNGMMISLMEEALCLMIVQAF